MTVYPAGTDLPIIVTTDEGLALAEAVNEPICPDCSGVGRRKLFSAAWRGNRWIELFNEWTCRACLGSGTRLF